MERLSSIVARWNELTRQRDESCADAVRIGGQEFDTFDEWAQAYGHLPVLEEILDEDRKR